MITKYKLYNGEVEVQFDSGVDGNKHAYKKDGKRVRGVTTIMNVLDKSGLINWAVGLSRDYLLEKNIGEYVITETDINDASRQHTIKKNSAADSGKLAHRWIEYYLNGENPDMPTDQEAVFAINAFKQFESEMKPEWLELEKVVYSRKHDYVGRFDALAMIDGKKTLIDFKTSKGVYREQFYQLGAYKKAWEEEQGIAGGVITKENKAIGFDKAIEEINNGKVIEQILILHLDKFEGNFSLYYSQDMDKDIEAFMACLMIKNWQIERGVPKPDVI